MSTIEQAIQAEIERQVVQAVENMDLSDGLAATLESEGYVKAEDIESVLNDVDFSDYGVLTNDSFSPGDFDLVERSDLPDFDDFVRDGSFDVEDAVASSVHSLLEQYRPDGCSIARRANDALHQWLEGVLDGELSDTRTLLIDFLASVEDEVATRKAELKAERKAAKKAEAKRLKAEKKAAEAKAKADEAEAHLHSVA